jgi:V8-like Glu-specific endopeptidase
VKSFFLILALLTLVQPSQILAQISETAEPFSVTYKLQPLTVFEEMPKISKALLLKEDEKSHANGLKVTRFAQMLPVGFHPFNSGTWDETGAGKVWRFGIHSQDAYSLYLVFNEFRLIPGARLFIYNKNFTSIAGAFTNKNNNRFNKLTIAPVGGDAIIIELDVPSGIDDFGKLTLGKVGHDYTNEFGNSKLKAQLAPSQPCHIDINCPAGDSWQTEKRAVCKLIVNGFFCTGTLINNVSNLKIPYLITAQHCVQNEQIAEEGVYFFNYEKISCGGINETSEQTLSGAELVATTDHKLDFSLLKLNEYPPLYFQPYFAGWDARPDIPQNGVSIHHPNGDVKKISVENHPLVTEDFGENYDAMSHWKVSHWEKGATEGGSSGGPIFNNEHRLFGTLSGGSPINCSNPINDYFTKFSLSWDKYPDPVNQVKHWLDPQKKGILFIKGVDPYHDSLGTCNNFWNIPKNEYVTLSSSNLKWGWVSGHNSNGSTQFAEKFLNQSTIRIQGVYFYVAKAYKANPFSTIGLKIWEGNSYPSAEIYSKQLYVKSLNENAINYIGLDSVVMVAGNFFIGYEINYNNPLDTFAIYHAASRGVNGPSTMYVYNDNTWQSIDAVSSPALYTSLSIGVMGCNGNIEVPQRKEIKVNPNPFCDKAQVDFPEGLTITNVTAYDYIGKVIPIKYQINENRLFLYAGYLPSGMYILELKTKSEPLYCKFTIVSK